MLFNFYIDGIVENQSNPHFHTHTHKLSTHPLSTILYADAVLQSLTYVGLWQLLSALFSYCNKEQLTINYSKIKMLVVSRRRIKHKQTINENPIEQVSNYKYLGAVFHTSGSWLSCIKYAAMNAWKSATEIVHSNFW